MHFISGLRFLFILYYLCTQVYADAFGVPVSDQPSAIPRMEFVDLSSNNKGLCGVNCLYFALKYFGNEKITYEKLQEAFPLTAKRGVNLRELRNYLEKEGYYCEYAELTDSEFVKRDGTELAIVLEETTDDLFFHMVVKMSDKEGNLKILDFPYTLKSVRPKEQEVKRQTMLLVSQIPPGKIFWHTTLIGTICLFLILGFFCFFKKRIGKNKQQWNLLSNKITCLIGSLVIFINLTVVSQASSSLEKTSGILVCDQPIFDFGTLAVGTSTTLTHRFRILNKAKKEIRILRVVSSCSCTGTEVSAWTIKPDEEFYIDATMTITKLGYQGLSAELVVLTDDNPMIPAISLKMTAKADYSPYFKPETLSLHDLSLSNANGMTHRVFLYVPSKVKMEQGIVSIDNKFQESIQVNVLRQVCTKRKDEKGDEYFLFVADINMTIQPSKLKPEDGVASILFNLCGGSQVSFHLHWKWSEAGIFMPALFVFPKNQETKETQLSYNSFLGGIPVSAKISGDGLVLRNTIQIAPHFIYTVERNSSKSGTGHLTIITNEGKTHQLKIQME